MPSPAVAVSLPVSRRATSSWRRNDSPPGRVHAMRGRSTPLRAATARRRQLHAARKTCRQSARQSVDCAEARVRQRKSAEQTRQGHIFTRDGLRPDSTPAAERAARHRPSLHSTSLIDWRASRQQLDELRKGVEARARCQSRRQVVSQFRITRATVASMSGTARLTFTRMFRRASRVCA